MIRGLKTTGYRLLDGFAADFDGLTVVIGANATGKSTLLDCLQLISNCVESPLRDALGWHRGLQSLLNAYQGSGSLQWALTFDKPTASDFWKSAPIPEGRRFVYEVTLSSDQYGEPIVRGEVLGDAEPRPGYQGPLKLLEVTPTESVVFDPRQGKLVAFDQAVPRKEPLLPMSPDGPGTTTPAPAGGSIPKTGSLRLSQMRFFNEFPEVAYIRLLLADLSFYPGFDVGRASQLRNLPAEIRPDCILLPDGSNLGSVLHEMLTRHAYRSSAEMLRDFFRNAYPSFDDIFAETTYGTPPKVLLRLREKGMKRSMEVWDLCDGMLRFLCLAAALLNATPPAMVAIDEPEAGLHPRLLPLLADMVKVASERTQVLVTTHSPDLLNCFDIENVAVMSREGSEIRWTRPANRQSLRKMLATVTGDTLGDLHRSGELENLG
jgi:predicted ATPase